MKNLFPLLSIIILPLLILSQEDLQKIPLQTNWTGDFIFIHNDNNVGCLFLDQGDKYYILLLDSNYNIIEEFRDKFYTNSTPKFVGSIATENKFELFFRRIELDVLLVLTIDIELKTLTRTKNYKITDHPLERIIYTGSNLAGNKMITISQLKDKIIYKEHLESLNIEKSIIEIRDEDKRFINRGSVIQFNSYSDSLTLLYKIHKFGQNNPRYKIVNIDQKEGTYEAVNIKCDDKHQHKYLWAQIEKHTIFLENCGKELKIFNRSNGDLINEILIDIDSIINNKEIKLFKYSLECKFNELFDPRYYAYLEGKERKIIRDFRPRFELYNDSNNTFLKLTFKGTINHSLGYYYYIDVYLPFDCENMRIEKYSSVQIPKLNGRIIYLLEKKFNTKAKKPSYFIGYNNKLMFGYLLKKSKEFIIEEVNF